MFLLLVIVAMMGNVNVVSLVILVFFLPTVAAPKAAMNLEYIIYCKDI